MLHEESGFLPCEEEEREQYSFLSDVPEDDLSLFASMPFELDEENN